MQNLLVAAGLLFVTVPACAWSEADETRQQLFTGLMRADQYQTETIARNPETYWERNAILGKHPTVETVRDYFTITNALHADIAKRLPSEVRAVWQLSGIALQSFVVSQNARLGLPVMVYFEVKF